MSKTVDILLVEDSGDDAEIVIRTLKKKGLADNLHWVHDGEEAIEILFGNEGSGDCPRVIFLDLKMPKIDGLEVLAALKRHPEKSKIPVVILTSSSEESDLLRCYDLGANSYVVKPHDFQEYSETINQLSEYWLTQNRVPN